MSAPPILRPYVRQSLARLGETRETSLSLDAQVAVIEDWAAANGYVVAPAIRDHDVRGDDPDRPGLTELDRSLQPGDTVAVYKFDRLARDVVLQESLVRRWQARDVQVISVTEPSTRLTRVIYGAVNEEFRDALSQRVRDAKRRQAERGHYTGGYPPYGYRRSLVRDIPLPDGGVYHRPSGPLVIDPAEAAIVREVYERTALGEPTSALARELNDRGIPSQRGSRWQTQVLRRILLNPMYYGASTYRGEPVGEGVHPPLVDRDLWDRAHQQLTARPRRRSKRHGVTHWLEGYVYHACGTRMYLLTESVRNGRVYYRAHYGCKRVFSADRCRQPRGVISMTKLDERVRRCLVADLSALAPVSEALARATVLAGGRETIERRQRLDERRLAVERRYERVRDAWASGTESLEWLAAEQVKRDEALAEIDAELRALPAAPDPEQYARIAERMRATAPVLAELDDGHLSALMAELGTVRVGADGIRIVYRDALTHLIPDPWIEPA